MKLLLATLHSRYIHSSLALPCLAAVCSTVAGLETVIREHTVNERPENILAALAGEHADVIAFSCYIWNIGQTLRLAAELKLLQPEVFIVLGGPEVSYGSGELMAENPQIDAIVHGEGEETLRRLMLLLAEVSGLAVTDEALQEIGSLSFRSGDEIILAAAKPSPRELDNIPSPFAAGLADISKPLIYFETSRGCPFSCTFCLSSVEQGVRSFSRARIESDLALLMAQGAETVKFVDRTFNYDAVRAERIWEFILTHNRGSRFHFEIAADLLTEDNINLLRSVPADTFRFEIGVQSAAAGTLSSVERRSDLQRLFANVRRLKAETAVTVHLDLVAGLPGEDLGGFGESLASLLALRPDHIQVEVLKMLKGTEIRRNHRNGGYRFSPYPPYRILQNSWLSFREICRIEECAERVEAIYNSGRFKTVMEMIARHSSGVDLFIPGEGAARLAGGRQPLQQFSAVLQLATAVFPGYVAEIRDALAFDYCLSGHPGGELPAFLHGAGRGGGTPVRGIPYPEIAARLSLPARSRFRTFVAVFDRDYTAAGWPEGETEITFVYVACDGGQRVFPLPVRSGLFQL